MDLDLSDQYYTLERVLWSSQPTPHQPIHTLLPYFLPAYSRSVLCVYQLHSAAINTLVVHDSFCVTGSDDKMLRVWPMDFSDYLLEVWNSVHTCCARCILQAFFYTSHSRC